MRSFKGKVHFKDGSKVTALLNTDAKINIIIKKLIEDPNLAMR